MRTDDLIGLLAHDPAPRWRFRPVFAIATVLGVAVAALLFFASIGIRRDFLAALATVRFPFKLALMLGFAAAATRLALAAGIPGERLRRRGWALAAVPVLLGCAVLAEMIALPSDAWMTRLIGHNSRVCLALIPLLALGPLALFLLALRQGAPTRPGLAGAVAGLAASAIGAAFYAPHCPDDSPLFVATWYSLAVLAVTAAGALVGRKLLRW